MSAPMEVEAAAAGAPAPEAVEIYEDDSDALYEGAKASIGGAEAIPLSKQFAQQCSVTARIIEDMGDAAASDDFAIPIPEEKCSVAQIAQIEKCLLGSHYVAEEIDVEKKDPKTGAPIKNDKGEVVKIKRVVRGKLVLPNAKKALEGLNFNQVCNLSIAVDYLEHNELLEPVAEKIASFVTGKDPAEIKKMCGIEREFTKEEIEQVYADHPWLRPKNADAPKQLEMVGFDPFQRKSSFPWFTLFVFLILIAIIVIIVLLTRKKNGGGGGRGPLSPLGPLNPLGSL